MKKPKTVEDEVLIGMDGGVQVNGTEEPIFGAQASTPSTPEAPATKPAGPKLVSVLLGTTELPKLHLRYLVTVGGKPAWDSNRIIGSRMRALFAFGGLELLEQVRVIDTVELLGYSVIVEK
jgi:hypothetical protein